MRKEETAVAPDPEWRRFNRARWDELVALHLSSYELTALRAGQGRLHPIEEAELGPVQGLRILHLQCHFGRDSLILAQQGAQVVGLDFSQPAIAAAHELALELGLAGRARFIEADVYDALAAVPERASFDLTFVSWGAIMWLPDIRRWAKIAASFLKPGGALYLADAHPTALVFDDAGPRTDQLPGYYAPYFSREPIIEDDDRDYADDAARLQNTRLYTWIHPLSDIITGLLEAGLALSWLHEHAYLPWRMFQTLVEDPGGMYRWPDRPWLPLAFSLKARRDQLQTVYVPKGL